MTTGPTVSTGAWFGITHVCPDGRETAIRWEESEVPRRWLVCKRCRYAVRLVTRPPRRGAEGGPGSAGQP